VPRNRARKKSESEFSTRNRRTSAAREAHRRVEDHADDGEDEICPEHRCHGRFRCREAGTENACSAW
jgi:hypothetical protein